MKPLSSPAVTAAQSGHWWNQGAWRWCAGATLMSVLAACGGGGTGSGERDASAALQMNPSRSEAIPTQSEAAKKSGSNPTLMAQPVSLANTTTAGDQTLRAMGALADGGYAVAWVSGTTLYTQRYDGAGNKSGTETVIPLVIDARDTASSIFAARSIAVLEDGSVVVAYAARRTTTEPNGPVITENGVYVQRFSASGAQVLAETQLVSLFDGDPRRPTTFQAVQVLPMPDGGYVIGWGAFSTSATVGLRTSFSTQRFDSTNQRVGGIVNVGATINPTRFQIVADAHSGYTVYLSGMREDFSPTGLIVTHYDASPLPTQILTGVRGNALLLRLEAGEYVLFTTGEVEGAAHRQFLDSSGAPVGERTSVSFMPVSAQLLADGTYMVFGPATTGGMTAQRFNANGEPMDGVLAVEANGTPRPVVALAGGGFAVGWSASGAGGDLDVYTQRFIEVTANDRKDCRLMAKGLRGHERKAFMDACLG